MTIIDQMHRSVTLTDYPPKRIVSTVPSQTELLFYLGLDEEVVGITKFCVHPREQFRAKKKIGGTKQLKLEEIAALNPDLIIGNKEENQQEQMEWLMERFPVWMSDIYNLSDATAMIRSVSQLVGKELSGAALAQQISDSFEGLAGIKPRKTAYLIWKGPYMAAASDTFIDHIMGWGGLENVFSEKKRYPAVTLTQLKDASPELLLLSSEPYPFKQKHVEEFQKELPNTRVMPVDGELFSWYGNRLLQTADYLKWL
jgi:ABC-type Fe3+-hydroxamate transport system substrate-binding protein